MNYSQSANPNATNGEQDAKKIITHKELTSAQRDELIEQFVEIQVDNMDTQTLVEFVTDLLIDEYSKFTDSELKERVECYHDDLYEELVDNVNSEKCQTYQELIDSNTKQYPKQPDSFGGQS